MKQRIAELVVVLITGIFCTFLVASTNFPTNLDTYTDKTSSDVITAAGWNNMQDAIEACEAKIGKDSSAVTTSHDYKLGALETTMGTLQSDLTLVATSMGTHTHALDFRGCLAYKSSSQNGTTTSTTATFDAEHYDTDSIHSTSSNTTRLTVPSGVSYVRLFAFAYLTGIGDTNVSLAIQKNGAEYYGRFEPTVGTSILSGFATEVLAVTAGDYFELVVITGTDTSYVVAGSATYMSQTKFGMEILE